MSTNANALLRLVQEQLHQERRRARNERRLHGLAEGRAEQAGGREQQAENHVITLCKQPNLKLEDCPYSNYQRRSNGDSRAIPRWSG